MDGLTTFSWYTFFILLLILVGIWFLSTKTRAGRRLVTSQTPWSIAQWTRLLLVLSITFFILVDPIFHLLTFGIFAILYYVFVNKNLLNTNIKNFGVRNEIIGSPITFPAAETKVQEFVCVPNSHSNLIRENKAINRCLFSFPYIESAIAPKVKYLDGEYHLALNLSSEKFTSSLIDNLKKAGFEVKLKNK